MDENEIKNIIESLIDTFLIAGDVSIKLRNEGLQKEITDGLVSQAEWSDMNVIQRKAMADAIGVSVQDMAKMVAGEQTSAQLAK